MPSGYHICESRKPIKTRTQSEKGRKKEEKRQKLKGEKARPRAIARVV
jgi:hypothetical protein